MNVKVLYLCVAAVAFATVHLTSGFLTFVS